MELPSPRAEEDGAPCHRGGWSPPPRAAPASAPPPRPSAARRSGQPTSTRPRAPLRTPRRAPLRRAPRRPAPLRRAPRRRAPLRSLPPALAVGTESLTLTSPAGVVGPFRPCPGRRGRRGSAPPLIFTTGRAGELFRIQICLIPMTPSFYIKVLFSSQKFLHSTRRIEFSDIYMVTWSIKYS